MDCSLVCDQLWFMPYDAIIVTLQFCSSGKPVCIANWGAS